MLASTAVTQVERHYGPLMRDLQALCDEPAPELQRPIEHFLARAADVTERHAEALHMPRSEPDSTPPVPGLWG